MDEKSPEQRSLPRIGVSPELESQGVKIQAAVLFGVEVKRNLSGPLKKEIAAGLGRLDVEKVLGGRTVEGYRALNQLHGEPDSIPAAVALWAIIRRGGRLPNISNVVDLYNLESAKTGLAIGAHDLSKIQGNVSIRPIQETDRFVPLGSEEPMKISGGRYAAVDDSGEILCFMESRQSDVTKVTPGPDRDILIYIQGNANTEKEHLRKTLEELCGRIVAHGGGRFEML